MKLKIRKLGEISPANVDKTAYGQMEINVDMTNGQMFEAMAAFQAAVPISLWAVFMKELKREVA